MIQFIHVTYYLLVITENRKMLQLFTLTGPGEHSPGSTLRADLHGDLPRAGHRLHGGERLHAHPHRGGHPGPVGRAPEHGGAEGLLRPRRHVQRHPLPHDPSALLPLPVAGPHRPPIGQPLLLQPARPGEARHARLLPTQVRQLLDELPPRRARGLLRLLVRGQLLCGGVCGQRHHSVAQNTGERIHDPSGSHVQHRCEEEDSRPGEKEELFHGREKARRDFQAFCQGGEFFAWVLPFIHTYFTPYAQCMAIDPGAKSALRVL
ncbi:hypothetical protein CEXT_797581 [Caerostris extrusa]|uniref:Uncharacterized protein n=1 Tax=Caerostris extrusa TaxID=172846 RepID=A0AAV4UPR9_CAEEX|nr:hypothetical protein CEXT_797581 [Caerostris extrusa]